MSNLYTPQLRGNETIFTYRNPGVGDQYGYFQYNLQLLAINSVRIRGVKTNGRSLDLTSSPPFLFKPVNEVFFLSFKSGAPRLYFLSLEDYKDLIQPSVTFSRNWSGGNLISLCS